ncbi:MAG: hypothetical protein KJ749_04095 [Planctomycetes bacterium]|nr:hypothetical protein [Planctomycetota bacterium]
MAVKTCCVRVKLGTSANKANIAGNDGGSAKRLGTIAPDYNASAHRQPTVGFARGWSTLEQSPVTGICSGLAITLAARGKRRGNCYGQPAGSWNG